VRRRGEADIWKDLHEWVLFESGEELPATKKAMQKLLESVLPGRTGQLEAISDPMKQQLTHQTITGRFMRVKLARKSLAPPGYQWVSKSALRELAFPKFITGYLEQHPL
jgi:A/G-specific adenine glycosylase